MRCEVTSRSVVMYRNLTVIRLSIVSCTYAVCVLQWAAPDLPDDDMSSLT